MEFKAFKMDGLGNDFIIIDRRITKISLSKEQIIKLAKRDNIGFDQVIFIDSRARPQLDAVPVPYPLKIYNSDGLETSACGNGSRCVASFLDNEKYADVQQLMPPEWGNIFLEVSGRIIHANILDENLVKIDMGAPVFDWKKIPLSKNLDYKNINLNIDKNEFKEGFALNVGNPHIIFFVKNCFNYDLKKIGPLIENHQLFPEKTNVTFAEVKDKNNIKVNVWERGAGLTKACGTAGCATAVAGHLKGFTDKKINIEFKEGILNIEYIIPGPIDAANGFKEKIIMIGPVSEIEEINIKI